MSSWLATAVIAITTVVDGPAPVGPASSFERAAQPLPVAVLLQQASERHGAAEGPLVAGRRTLRAATAASVADPRRVFAAWVAPPSTSLFELPAVAEVDDPPLAPGPLTQLAALLVLGLALTRRPRHPELPGLPPLPPHVPASPNLLGSVR